MSEYRVNLDVYAGPLDLLLYLIRREEVDIHDIPVARITEQYLEYVNLLKQVDPNLAGEFLVMAATLLEIKTRMLLPAAPVEEGEEGDADPLDPRAELVRQLLEYKAFKDAAGDLRRLGDRQAQRFPRAPVTPDFDEQETELADVQVWDLLDAFNRLLAEIGKEPDRHEVIYDDTPVELHAEDILDRLGREGAMSFRQIFAGRTRRTEVVGLFLAMLELVRRKKILTHQGDNFGDIQVMLNPDPPPEDEDDEPFFAASEQADTAADAAADTDPEDADAASPDAEPEAATEAEPDAPHRETRP